MRRNQESLGTIRRIVMAVVVVLILLAFFVSRLHLRVCEAGDKKEC